MVPNACWRLSAKDIATKASLGRHIRLKERGNLPGPHHDLGIVATSPPGRRSIEGSTAATSRAPSRAVKKERRSLPFPSGTR